MWKTFHFFWFQRDFIHWIPVKERFDRYANGFLLSLAVSRLLGTKWQKMLFFFLFISSNYDEC